MRLGRRICQLQLICSLLLRKTILVQKLSYLQDIQLLLRKTLRVQKLSYLLETLTKEPIILVLLLHHLKLLPRPPVNLILQLIEDNLFRPQSTEELF